MKVDVRSSDKFIDEWQFADREDNRDLDCGSMASKIDFAHTIKISKYAAIPTFEIITKEGKSVFIHEDDFKHFEKALSEAKKGLDTM